MSSAILLLPPPIRLLPPVVAIVGGNEVVGGGAVIVRAEEDDDEEEEGDENGDEDDVVVVPEAVVSSVVAAVVVFCVKSIVLRTGWHISAAAAGVPTSIADAHNSKLLTLAGIVTLIGRLIGACSFPRIRLTSIPIFLVERLLLVAAVPPSGSPSAP